MKKTFIITILTISLILLACTKRSSQLYIGEESDIDECQKDSQCVIVNKKLNCSACDPCTTTDYASDEYVSVNEEKFKEFKADWTKKNCSDLYNRCYNSELTYSDECYISFSCPDCISIIKNRNLGSKCIDNKCSKSHN